MVEYSNISNLKHTHTHTHTHRGGQRTDSADVGIAKIYRGCFDKGVLIHYNFETQRREAGGEFIKRLRVHDH